MTEERRAELLGHIAQAAGLAGSYVEGMSKEDFLADTRTQQAVIMNLVIIGEAAAKLMQDHPGFVQSHPEVPWNRMKGMRNRIAHGYFEIDLGIVWDTIHADLPDLLKRLPAQ